MAYRNGDIYEGYWRQGKKHGSGRFITAQGVVCEGMWREDHLTGWGDCELADGTKKAGHWKTGLLDGLGVTENSDSITMGRYLEDKISEMSLKLTRWNDFTLRVKDADLEDEYVVEFKPDSVRWGTYWEGGLQGNMTVMESSGVRYVGSGGEGDRAGEWSSTQLSTSQDCGSRAVSQQECTTTLTSTEFTTKSSYLTKPPAG